MNPEPGTSKEYPLLAEDENEPNLHISEVVLEEFAPNDEDEISTTLQEEYQDYMPGDGDAYPFYKLMSEFRLNYTLPKSLFTDESKGVMTLHLDDEESRKVDEKFNFTQYFTLKCYPNGDGDENDGYVSLMFERNTDHMLFELQSLNVTLTVLDLDKNQRFPPQSITVDQKRTIRGDSEGYALQYSYVEEEDFGLSRYLKRDSLLSSEFFSGEKLLLQCEVQYHTIENALDEGSPYDRAEWYDENGQFQMSIILYTDHPVWTVLCKISPYFSKLINLYGVKEITSFDKSDNRALTMILRYLMSGIDLEKHSLSTQELFNLYEFSDYVLISELKEKCSDMLKDRMTSRIACNVIAMADMHSDVDLKMYATRYAIFHWRKVAASNSWSILCTERPDLEKKINDLKDKSSRKRKRSTKGVHILGKERPDLVTETKNNSVSKDKTPRKRKRSFRDEYVEEFQFYQ